MLKGVIKTKRKILTHGQLLVDIILPEGTESIGECAFMDCLGLTDITLPYGTDLGTVKCKKLQSQMK